MKIWDNGQSFPRKNLSGKFEYLSFVPTPLGSLADLRLPSEAVRLLSACSRKIGELEGNPIVDVNFVSERLGIARTTAANLVKSFCGLGILVQSEAGKQRYRTYLYEDYLSSLRRGGDPLP